MVSEIGVVEGRHEVFYQGKWRPCSGAVWNALRGMFWVTMPNHDRFWAYAHQVRYQYMFAWPEP